MVKKLVIKKLLARVYVVHQSMQCIAVK